ncbi:hypothetical protein ACFXOD_24275 [Streptomyces sp. NPDC059161]|uniref:hypothetical protein n=1 Tax=Streptomyces sp. NPDC059161 TaxID=3346749 RepID=UPI0036CA6953
MRKILLATAATACLTLTACASGDPGGSHDSADKPPAAGASGPQPATPTPPAANTPAAPGPDAAALALGVASRTVGTELVGILEITPTTVVHTRKAHGTASRFGTFAVITTKDASLSANAADEEPANGTKGGWRWIAANGQSVFEGTGAAHKVLVSGYNGVGRIEPGGHQLRSEVFDLTPDQADGGGILVYVDAAGGDSRWRIPAVDFGPQVADVRKRLAS